jgi:monoamine oxidase
MALRSYDVIVVGAGLAGAIAARELRAARLQTMVVEARSHVGGRVESRPFSGTSALIETGGTSVTVGQENMSREIERYGFRKEQSPAPDRRVWCLGGTRRSDSFPIPLGEGLEAERVLSLIHAAANRIRTSVPHDQQALTDLDVPASEFIDRLQAPPVTRDLIRAWVDHQGLDTSSALWHLHAIARIGGLGALTSQFRVATGATSLVEAIMEEGALELLLSSPVTGIRQDARQVTVTIASGEELLASRAVVAVPVNVLRTIRFEPGLNAGKQAMAREGHAGEAIKVFALVEGLPDAVSAFGWGVGNMSVYSTYRMLSEGNLVVGFGHPSPDFDPTSPAHVEASLRTYFDGVRVLAIDGHDWVADPFARGTHMVSRPGQLCRLMSSLSASEGRLHFAGADISTGWMSYMEGAMETGRRAADEVRASFARDTRLTLA